MRPFQSAPPRYPQIDRGSFTFIYVILRMEISPKRVKRLHSLGLVN